MFNPDATVFSFAEADHLTRIHLKLALEDMGFAVFEHACTITIGGGMADDDRDRGSLHLWH